MRPRPSASGRCCLRLALQLMPITIAPIAALALLLGEAERCFVANQHLRYFAPRFCDCSRHRGGTVGSPGSVSPIASASRCTVSVLSGTAYQLETTSDGLPSSSPSFLLLQETMADSLGAGVGAVSTSRQGVDSGSAPDKKRAVSWMDRFGQLQNFKEMHGHTLVPKRYGNDEMIRQNPADGGGVSVDRQDSSTMRGLGAWVQRQRQRRDRLSPVQIDLLNQLGFCWSAVPSASAAAATTTFPSPEAGTRVTFPSLANAAHLTSLAAIQTASESNAAETTTRHPRGLKSEEDFVSSDSLWWDQFLRLTSLYDSVSDVPKSSTWAIWLRRQRQNALSSSSSSCCTHQRKREAALRSWDDRWDWTAHDWRWDERFRQLVAYRERHGDCCVPIHSNQSDNGGDAMAGLGLWVSAQRKSLRHLRHTLQQQQQQHQHQSSSVSASMLRRDNDSTVVNQRLERRFRRLESIGFVWSIQELLASQWEQL